MAADTSRWRGETVAVVSVDRPTKEAYVDRRESIISAESGALRSCGWSAVDVEAEAALEARFNQKLSFRRALVGWLIEFNKY